MNGIKINIDPMIGHVGPIMPTWYGLFVALAVAIGWWLGLREARRRGLDVEKVHSLILWSVLGGLVGARLFHVVDRPNLYAADPLRALYVWEGGLAIYGGLVGGVLTGLLCARWRGIPAWRMADAAAPGLILGQALGRLACIPNGDAYGAPTDVPWAFIYTNPKAMLPPDLLGVPLHPYPVYELLFDLALLGLLWKLRDIYKTDGLLFLTYAGVYAAGRFFLTFFRMEQVWFFGLQEAQVVSLAVLVLTVPLVSWRLQAKKTAIAEQGGSRDLENAKAKGGSAG
ncbi:MAG: prolipoprotein diacylglyceryl transferase [Rubrobacteraceae bacterium]|nr:prolipoprotein diacylglyceryl transferase [Rubrobacteraceae bacterium]